MTSDLLIRRATPDDAAGIADVLNPIVAARIYSAMVTPVTEKTQREFIETLPPRSLLHVAVEPPGRIVGLQEVLPFCAGTASFDHVGVIGSFVALDRHRRGIGARLFAVTFDAARALGYEKLFAFVRADNEAGLRAYTGQGFRKIGTAAKHCKVDGRYVDEIVIERFL
jgi:L-amino acid N-acyltransferase YncA